MKTEYNSVFPRHEPHFKGPVDTRTSGLVVRMQEVSVIAQNPLGLCNPPSFHVSFFSLLYSLSSSFILFVFIFEIKSRIAQARLWLAM